MRKPGASLRIPFLELLGAHAEERGKGRAVASLDLRPALANSWQVAHGGVVMTLLDVSMALAARSTVAQGAGVMTEAGLAAGFGSALGSDARVVPSLRVHPRPRSPRRASSPA